MGGEFGASREWSHEQALDWSTPGRPGHAGVQRLVADLNALYRGEPALHAREIAPDGFEWLDHRDAPHSVMSWLRCGPEDFCVVVLNATPVTRRGYRIGLPRAGCYRERLNTDSAHYGGGDLGNGGVVVAEPQPWHGRLHSAEITLPPLSVLLLKPD
jgi:1,4-alpha-glucan branching enzyme